MYYTTTYFSPIGQLVLASNEEALIGVWFKDQKYFAETLKNFVTKQQTTEILRRSQDWLERYFAGEQPDWRGLKLSPQGSAFRQNVWEILKKIPYGKTITYGQIARQLAQQLDRSSMSAQAVGGAVGHNPISIIIPCHRVVGSDGSLTGYAGGIERKLWLLQHEGANNLYFESLAEKK